MVQREVFAERMKNFSFWTKRNFLRVAAQRVLLLRSYEELACHYRRLGKNEVEDKANQFNLSSPWKLAAHCIFVLTSFLF